MVPLVLKRVNMDPALASGVIVTTFSDVIGFLVFLGLGSILIDKLV
jgi:magnesium transporter